MLRLDPQLAVFRTAPDRIAIGAQQPIAVLDADGATLQAIAALTRGVLRPELEQLLGDEPAQELLTAIAPGLIETRPRIPIRVRGRIRLAHDLHRAAREAGHPVGDDGVIIAVAPWRLPQRELERLHAGATAHLPVLTGDAWVQIGPFVPAGGGCVQCAKPGEPSMLPAHLEPVPTPVAAAQAVVSVLGALQRVSEETLPEAWAVRIALRDGTVSALRRRRACAHRRPRLERVRGRALPGSGMAA